ncbi:unnamed protein product [Ectocarpus sp. 12 AP-2014]
MYLPLLGVQGGFCGRSFCCRKRSSLVSCLLERRQQFATTQAAAPAVGRQWLPLLQQLLLLPCCIPEEIGWAVIWRVKPDSSASHRRVRSLDARLSCASHRHRRSLDALDKQAVVYAHLRGIGVVGT